MRLPVIITKGEDGYYVAEIPILKGCISQGKTKKEALENITEAAELCLECMDEEGWGIPVEYSVNHVEVGV
jgi:predicted RNase H-like HicB family nuclease